MPKLSGRLCTGLDALLPDGEEEEDAALEDAPPEDFFDMEAMSEAPEPASPVRAAPAGGATLASGGLCQKQGALSGVDPTLRVSDTC